jgi:hypothetical protein
VDLDERAFLRRRGRYFHTYDELDSLDPVLLRGASSVTALGSGGLFVGCLSGVGLDSPRLLLRLLGAMVRFEIMIAWSHGQDLKLWPRERRFPM